MFAIIADVVDSTHRDEDIVDEVCEGLNHRHGAGLILPFERTAGDEIEALTRDSDVALAVILELTRSGDWSVGCGIGTIRGELPPNVRAANGSALVSARSAVTAAKRARHRFALAAADGGKSSVRLGPVVDLLLDLRARRTIEGWQVVDLLRGGLTPREVARRLALTQSAVAQRVAAAHVQLEDSAAPEISGMLRALDRQLDPAGSDDRG